MLTIRKPIVYPFIKDVKKEEDVEVGVYEPGACLQIEIAHNFLVDYTSGLPTSSGMGGVVIFEGDRKNSDQDGQWKPQGQGSGVHPPA